MTESPQWSPQQAQALDAVNAWWKDPNKKQIFKVFGYAGTGKTTLAKHFAADRRVHYCAFTGKAAHVMKKKGCEPASTIHSLIYIPEEDPDTGEMHFILRDRLGKSMKAESTIDDIGPDTQYDLIILDECSMVDEDLGADLTSFGTPILVLGDPAQLPPIRGTGYFNDNPDIVLTEIHRQAADNPIIRMATDVREGKRLQLGSYGDSKVMPKNSVDPAEIPHYDQILCGFNRTRSKLNHGYRAALGHTDFLPQPEDRLICLRNNHSVGLLNGAQYYLDDPVTPVEVEEVIRKSKPKVDIQFTHMNIRDSEDKFRKLRGVKTHVYPFMNAEQPEFYARAVAEEFDYAYAITVHKSQGSQWDNILLFNEWKFGDDRHKWLYTGLTRAAERITVIG